MKEDKLHSVNSTGFKTPKDYFESFDEKLMQRLNEEKLMEGISSPGFTVPKDYFASVETEILNKVTSESNTKVVRLFSRKQLYFVSGIAASLLLMLAIFNGSTTEELSVEMVESYFESSDINSYELAQMMSDTDFLEDDFIVTETIYTEENLETYLLENTDIESIIE
ncbi:hypothetical protein BTO05_04270 [Winogradskyella sp. PC-19]|uniref:hypothetical protein n=1 Tax=unclassified Winogradskyella TaxID=2615021 RepID=UPI000B3CD04A|nr:MULTISPECIES: hypothetical protein [unclassified Winogradskyella]ARV08887.1 hypothetical protein BTO05_04270 [Winogradskyella sp. PC-19]